MILLEECIKTLKIRETNNFNIWEQQQKKSRAMRSRRSGVKSLNIVKKNLEVLKKLRG